MERCNPRTMEYFHRMGIADRYAAAGLPSEVPMGRLHLWWTSGAGDQVGAMKTPMGTSLGSPAGAYPVGDAHPVEVLHGAGDCSVHLRQVPRLRPAARPTPQRNGPAGPARSPG